MILWLLGCSMAPYGEYWPDKTAYPIVGGGVDGEGGWVDGDHSRAPAVQHDDYRWRTQRRSGGADDRAVQVRLPDLPPAQRPLPSRSTGKGASTAESALRVTGDL